MTAVRRVADTNWQKIVGVVPDLFGCITQFQALSAFAAGCYSGMPDRGTEGRRFHYVVGAGYWAYVVCLLAAMIRVAVHILTPVPGGGTGCQCVEYVTGIDIDGDGKVGGRAAERELNRKKYEKSFRKSFTDAAKGDAATMEIKTPKEAPPVKAEALQQQRVGATSVLQPLPPDDRAKLDDNENGGNINGSGF